MLIDTHCHLNFAAFEKDLPDIVRRANEAGVTKIIIPGTDLVSSKRAVQIAQTYDSCYAAVGIHPHHAQDPNLTPNNDLRHELEKLIVGDGPTSAKASAGKIVAVGEIGLDNHTYKKSKYENVVVTDEIKRKQKDLLELQLELALIHNKPVIFHSREAYDELIQTISQFSRIARRSLGEGGQLSSDYIPVQGWSASGGKPEQDPVKTLRGVFHCFTGSTSQLQLIITMGYYVGFDGNITYSSDYSSLVAATPLNKILLETDAPFLTPHPHRGTRNEPKYLPLIAKQIAEYHQTPLAQVIDSTTTNTLKLFGLS